MKSKTNTFVIVFVLVICLCVINTGRCERIKDIVDVHGLRSNPLSGIGLVVGLAGTGDSSLLSRQMLTNLLREQGLVLSPTDLSGNNIAVVMVTSDLGPFDHEGSRLDVSVSAIGDAKSLQGGTLLSTLLKGLDGQIYAIADGGVSIGGWTASGEKSTVTKNHQTVGRIPNGAIVEEQELSSFFEKVLGDRIVTLNLRNDDFTTAEEIRRAINVEFPESAKVADAGTIQVKVPGGIEDEKISGFISDITRLEVKVDSPAVVVINERTGTIVVGENVAISAVAISQGSLVVKISEMEMVSQPVAPFSNSGTTEKVQDTAIEVTEPLASLIPMPRSVTVSELAKSLNSIGATPSDIIAIFNALKKAGALQAKLEMM
ncbi:MAG: flagellar basal body P-ring protein FlgI [Sedimentisphaerales bacterium]|nr:flagellar basal body P-ring protein FlgI [Sedimentisphaerales bacterium]